MGAEAERAKHTIPRVYFFEQLSRGRYVRESLRFAEVSRCALIKSANKW